MRAWQWIAVAGFPAMALVLRAWKLKRGYLTAAYAWSFWLSASMMLALLGQLLAQRLDRQSLGPWAGFEFQARLCLLALLPGFLSYAEEWVHESDFRRSFRLALGGGALAPFLAGAYGLYQASGLLAAFVPLAAARWVLGLEIFGLRLAFALALVHAVIFFNASGIPAEAVSRIALLASMALVAGPPRLGAGAAGLLGGALVLLAKRLWAPHSSSLYWQIAVASGIGLGWMLASRTWRKKPEHAAAA